MMATATSYAQGTQSLYMTDQSKSDVVRNLASSQYGNGKEQQEKEEQTKKSTYTHGEDKWLKNKDAQNTRYSEFKVYDINGKNKEDVVMGLITGDLNRDTRYNKLGENPTPITLAQTDVQVIEVSEADLTSGMKVSIAGFRTQGKYFVILGENDYRYIDGKAIVGDAPVVSELKKGKPITAITFFYELQKAGLADKEMTAKQFLSLSTNDQQAIVNAGSVASK